MEFEPRISYTIISSGENMMAPKPEPKTVLKVIHNAGFFSCMTIRLMDIISYFNLNQELPDEVDSTSQFLHFKSYAGENLVPYYINEQSGEITYSGEITLDVYDCMSIQFREYSKIPFEEWKPFIDKYFTPSNEVLEKAEFLRKHYGINTENSCAVFYRGNDKEVETPTASYDMFIDKAKEIQNQNEGIQFVVLPDEKQFMNAFAYELRNSKEFKKEVGSINRNTKTAVFYETKRDKRKEREAWYNAAVYLLSQCKHVITHSGNGGLWLALYRGNSININQYFDGKWIM